MAMRAPEVLSVLIATLFVGVLSVEYQGYAFTAYQAGSMTGPDSAEALQELAVDKSDSVELVVTWYQAWLNSTTIAPDPQKSETETDIAAFVVDARKAGLKIHLKPHVDCLCGTWRAKIGTQFTTEAQWSAWFASYNQYMANMTAIAVKYRFDSFNVGTEMIGVSGRESDWRTVVHRVRAVYAGPLLYGANWGDEPWQVQWWDAVDFIGVDAYYPLANAPDPSLATLRQNWLPVKQNLSDLAAKWNKKLWFPEIGYRSVSTAAMSPGSYVGHQPADLQAQVNLYQAFFDETFDEPWLHAVFFWSWSPNPLQGGRCDNGYTVHNKPAETIVQKYFGAGSVANTPYAAAAKAVTVYADGVLGSGWSSWSYKGTFEADYKQNPFPGHSASFAGLNVVPYGAISLHYPGFSTVGHTHLSLNIRVADSAKASYSMWICTCDSCDATCQARTVNILNYLPASAGCTIPDSTTWASSQLVIPLADLQATGVSVHRITLSSENADGETTNVFIDNVMFQ